MNVASPSHPVAAGGSVATAAPRVRFDEFDVLRGAAIIMVVYLHAYFRSWDVTPHRQVVAMHVIHLFAHTAVPSFLFISAFFLARDGTPTFPEFVRKKVARVILPVLFWVLAAVVYRSAYLGETVDGTFRKDILLFNISGQYFYLLVLVGFYVAFFFLRGWSSRRLAWLAGGAFTANLATIAWYESSTMSGDFATLAYRNPLVWIFAYSFGFWVGRQGNDFRWPHGLSWAAASAMTALGCLYIARGEWADSYPVSYFGVNVFLFSACSFLVYPAAIRWALGRREWGLITGALDWLGGYAFGIYLVHMPFFIGFVTERWIAPSPVNDDWWRLMNLEFAVGFGTATLFVWLIARLWPRFGRDLLGVN